MFSNKALSLQRLQKEIEYAEFHLTRALNESPQELDDIVRLQDWLDTAYSRESKLRQQLELERFFKKPVEIDEKVVERLSFRVENWKNAVVKVARDFAGRFVKREVVTPFKAESWKSGSFEVARDANGRFVSWRKA